jgi:5-methyltetrahydrofolate--homocysteine methyltransferase
MPEANIILGVSNVSFGLNPAARVVLNSIFLHECVEAGMNSAIVNASKILPLNRFNEHEIEVALDLIYDRANLKATFAHTTRSANLRRCFKAKRRSQ